MKQIIWYTIVVLLTLCALALFWQFRLALLLFILSLIVAAAFRPLIERMVEHKIPRVAAILIAYLAVLGILGILIALASGPLVDELQRMTDNFAVAYTRFRQASPKDDQFRQFLAERLPPIDAIYQGAAGDRGAALARSVLGAATGALDVFSNLIIILILSIYWSIDRFHFERLWLSMLPANGRVRAREIWRQIEEGIGSYIRSEVVQSVLAAVLLYLFYRLIGLNYPTTLAIIGAILWLIPWLGAVLAVIPAFLAGLSSGLPTALLAAFITLLVLGLMEVVVEPRLFNRRRYSSLLIVLLLVAMSDAFGLIGLIFAPPLAAAIQIFFSNLLTQPATVAPVDPDTRFITLRAQLSQAEEMADQVKGEAPEVANLLERLKKLVNKTEDTVRAQTVR
jgi:putative permease